MFSVVKAYLIGLVLRNNRQQGENNLLVLITKGKSQVLTDLYLCQSNVKGERIGQGGYRA